MSRRNLREPVDVERHVAERMRRECESGATQAAICRGLNADCIRTPHGGPWSPPHLEDILRAGGYVPMCEGSAALNSPHPMQSIG